MTLTARPGLAILFVLPAALALFLALSLSGPPAQAQDGSVSDQDEESDVSYVTVVVDRTLEPSVAQFTVTWNDAHEGKCSTQYNAYLVDYFVDTEDVHLGSATSDDVQIVKSVDYSGMDGGLGYRVNLFCGDTDDYRYVSWIRLLGGLPSGTYSSEPALIGLVVDSGSLEPAFHQYKFSYVVDDVPASRERITVTATAKDGLYSIVFVEGHVRWTGQGCGASECQFNYDNESREELDTLEDVDADTPGFQLDLEEGQTDFSIHVHPLVDGGNVYQFSVTSSTPAPTPEPTPTPTPEPTPTPTRLTAGFQDAPDSHEGTSEGTGAFTFRIAFSEPISISYVTLRDNSLDVTNGSATKAKRMNGQSDLWQITVEPDSDADVTVVLPITENCAAQDAVCTRDNKKLSNRLELTVPGPEGSGQNSPATGAPTITGTAQVGETLTAVTSGIEDVDGLANVSFSYQWLANDAEIAGATDPTYTLVDDDAGLTIKVKVSFFDDKNNPETLTSAATTAVLANVPDAPEHPNVSLHDTGALDVSWEAPSTDGGSAITEYRVQWKETAGNWDAPADVSEETATGTTHTITGLTDGVEYTVRIIAVNDVGDGPPSGEATGTPREATAPVLTKATVKSVHLGTQPEAAGANSGDEPVLVGSVTVVVTQDNSDPDNVITSFAVTSFAVTWRDYKDCASEYNAYFATHLYGVPVIGGGTYLAARPRNTVGECLGV